MNIQEHDCVVLTRDLPGESLQAGDVGTVVYIHGQQQDFEVEFMTLTGRTVTVATVPASHLRPVGAQDMAHAREFVPR